MEDKKGLIERTRGVIGDRRVIRGWGHGDGMGPWLSRAHIRGPGSMAASPPVHWLGLVPKASRSCVAELWPSSIERKSPICPVEFLPFLPGQLRGSEA